MKSTSFALGSLLATVAIAQPHRQHQAFHHKRVDAPPVVWVTELDYVTETVGVTTTIWVSEGFVAPSSHSSPSTSSSPSSSSISPVPAQFFEPAQSSTPVPAPPAPTTSSSSSVYVAPPAPVSTSIPPTTPVSAPAPVVSVQSAPPSVPEVPTVAPYVPPSSTYVAPAPVSSTAPSSGSGGECSKSSPCEGDMTHYTAGMGACGWVNDGSTDKVVALPHGLMGTQSNGNPYCGKTITIMHNGKTTTAEVVDKCMGCTGYSIDLSDAAWMELESMDAATDVGRTTASWYFN